MQSLTGSVKKEMQCVVLYLKMWHVNFIEQRVMLFLGNNLLIKSGEGIWYRMILKNPTSTK